jgi:YidC/Oxa1 family membrane protein insertase
VFLPRTNGQTQFRVVSDNVKSSPNSGEALHAGAAVGGDARNRFDVFVGPKDYNLLKRVDKRLPQLVDFGTWFGWLARPLFLILNWINDSYVHNYGWAIIVVTIFINIALMPLRFSSIKSMKRMSDLQPQIQAINAKYKGVGLRDPKNQQKNAEVMELYKKHGINPMGGCLPMLIQMPFFIAFYTVLTVAIEMRGASWLWVHDLSQPETIPIRILPIAMIIAQFFQQKMTPNPSADPSQQRMMLIMPLVFGFMFYSASSGLVLYWLASNLIGIVQQLIINKTMGVPAVPHPAPATAPQPQRKTGNRR